MVSCNGLLFQIALIQYQFPFWIWFCVCEPKREVLGLDWFVAWCWGNVELWSHVQSRCVGLSSWWLWTKRIIFLPGRIPQHCKSSHSRATRFLLFLILINVLIIFLLLTIITLFMNQSPLWSTLVHFVFSELTTTWVSFYPS